MVLGGGPTELARTSDLWVMSSFQIDTGAFAIDHDTSSLTRNVEPNQGQVPLKFNRLLTSISRRAYVLLSHLPPLI